MVSKVLLTCRIRQVPQSPWLLYHCLRFTGSWLETKSLRVDYGASNSNPKLLVVFSVVTFIWSSLWPS